QPYLRQPRQDNPKSGAAELSRDNSDVTAIHQGALSRDRQTQSHAVILEGDCRLEQRSRCLAAQSRTGVMNFDVDLAIFQRRYTEPLALRSGGLRRILE